MNGARRQGGLTLLEVMLSLLIGALVVLVGGALLVAANASFLGHGAGVQLDDGGRYALAIIGQAVRQAAYVEWDSAVAPVGREDDSSANIAGLDARSVSHSGEGIELPLPAVANGSDVLALRYAGTGGGGNGDGSMLNCAGFGVGAPAAPDQRGWSIFYVAADAGGEAELHCKYRSAGGWGSDAIVRGVDSFQVLYGLDTDIPPDGIANQYVNASAVDALDAALVLSGATAAERARDKNRKTYWKRVASVRLALLLHGETGSRPDGELRRFDLFGAAYANAAGGDFGVRIVEANLPLPLQRRARQLFGATVALRNREP
ncbi:PilW family protein [Rugamonas sp.]|uniref:PilW family protein n=1 Tax=Rugamonas sp. TaxID=1926287 RepID=UPI0025D806B0|nr:PilW family protein [Rugamonas sp.]